MSLLTLNNFRLVGTYFSLPLSVLGEKEHLERTRVYLRYSSTTRETSNYSTIAPHSLLPSCWVSFCSTGLPLSITILVLSKFSSHCPLFSNQHLSNIHNFSSEKRPGMLGIEPVDDWQEASMLPLCYAARPCWASYIRLKQTLIFASLNASASMLLIGFPCSDVKLTASKLTKAFDPNDSMLFSRRINLGVKKCC